MNILGQYKNGNYNVTVFDDGTKIRENDMEFFEADFPESMDLKITNCCDMGCPMCHEDSKPDGKHGEILNLKFIDSLQPYTEIAIGGGNPLAHPDILEFLYRLREHKLIANMTVNQVHFMQNRELLMEMTRQHLIYGLGISLMNADPEFVNAVKKFPNAVIHVINGMITVKELERLACNRLKVLILGYKDFRRGAKYHEKVGAHVDERMRELYDVLPEVISDGWFQTVSFDNLAISQLNVKRLMTDAEWQEFYMGDDGLEGNLTSASMYVDAVRGEFAKNSCSTERYAMTENIQEMFQFLKSL